MNKIALSTIVAAAGLAASGASFAAAAPIMTGVTAPWYVGIGVNYTANLTDKIENADSTSGDNLKLNKRGVGGNLFVGYRANQFFGTELGLNMLGTDKYKATVGSTVDNNAFELKNQWNVNFVGQAFLPVTSWFSPYAFAGVAYINSQARYEAGSVTTKDDQNGFGLVYGGGLLFSINQFGIRASYTQQDLAGGVNDSPVTVNGNDFKVPQVKDYISLDVLYRFGA